ncbi:MAG TPA: PQQ-dependent sugar dehydrogenase [Planctomycetota bacterium]|nr:PQQ-dependent sugar dehydrogenase [Planctomycetota bacterium]
MLGAVVLAAPASCQGEREPGDNRLLELVDAFPGQKPFRRPVWLTWTDADADHFYVVEQFGTVYLVPRDGSTSTRRTFLDWTAKTLHPHNGGHNEEGLLGLAFDPDYERNRYVYIYYSHRPAPDKQRSVVSRLQAVDGIAGPVVADESELQLLVVPQPWGNHNGGTITFGPDGMLFVALGDGGAAGDPFDNAQNLSSLLGKVLRIDVRGATAEQPYRVPEDNPFVGREGARGEIWAYGLRNPWRIAFDRETGDLWCGDVGQDRFEEVDRLVKGGNYGWNLREAHQPCSRGRKENDGDAAHGDFIEPVAYYGRPDGYSVTGGFVYRGSRHEHLRGWYVFADFVTGHVWAVREDRAGGRHETRRIAEAGSKQVASFAELPDGELVLLCFDGRIYELR